MKFKNIVLAIVITISCGIIISGCSATDWATREIPDGSSLDKGDLITIVQKDGATQTGTYIGSIILSPTEYAEEYSHSERQTYDGKLLPRLGQNIRFLTTLSDSKIWKGELLGFDCSSLWIKSENSTEPEQVYFTSLKCLSARDGKVFHRMHLRNLFMNGDIPLMSAIEVEDVAGSHRVPVSSIDRILFGSNGTVVLGINLLLGNSH
jgi:hypothetical protein